MRKFLSLFACTLILLTGALSACKKTEYWYVTVSNLDGYEITANFAKTNREGKVIKVKKGEDLKFSITVFASTDDAAPEVWLNGSELEAVRDTSYTGGLRWNYTSKIESDGAVSGKKSSALDPTKNRYNVIFSDERALMSMLMAGEYTDTLYDEFAVRTNLFGNGGSIFSFFQQWQIHQHDNIIDGQEIIFILKQKDNYSLSWTELQYKTDGGEYRIAPYTDSQDERTFIVTITGNTTIYPVVCAALPVIPL